MCSPGPGGAKLVKKIIDIQMKSKTTKTQQKCVFGFFVFNKKEFYNLNYLLFLRVGPGLRRFLKSKRPSSSSERISASGGLRPPPALMRFEEGDGRFDPKKLRNPSPILKNWR
jgi:hypothetical protein